MDFFTFETQMIDSERLMLTCQGILNFSNSHVYAKKIRAAILAQPIHQCIFDLSQLESVDSSGLGIIINLFPLAKEKGFEIILCNPSLSIRSIFSLSHFDHIFKIRKLEDVL